MVNIFTINRNLRNIRRYRDIVRVLFKYGFDNLLEYLNLHHLARKGRRLLRRDTSAIAEMTPAERMRLALEELGPTFIKLGQILSTRPDIVPPEFVIEFARLQDRVAPVDFDAIRSQVELELKGTIEDFFSRFDEEPIAAASVAQVHRARLKSGEEVVVKVRRPGVTEVIATDIDALRGLAHLAHSHLPGSELYNPVGLVKEFSRTIRRELDFSREGHTIEKFRSNFAGDRTLHFPDVHWQCTTRGLLTMEYIDGIKVSDLPTLALEGLDRKTIARRGADAFLKQVLVHGFFHGDPHPGNVFILPGNVICLLDYGMVGRVDPTLRNYLSDVIMCIVSRDMEELVALMLHSGDIVGEVNERVLQRDLSDFVDSYYELPLKEIEVGRMMMEFIEIVTTHHIRLQPDVMLLAKALVSIEGMGRMLDPDFDMVGAVQPFIKSLLRERVSPKRVMGSTSSLVMSYVNLTRSLPRDLRDILNRLKRNNFRIDLEHRGLDRFIRELDKSVNRLSSSLIIAALIVGSSIVMEADKGPKLLGVSFLAFLGYAIAGLIGLWWIVAILRSGRL
jgi:ubiquinone biosynthesis protein